MVLKLFYGVKVLPNVKVRPSSVMYVENIWDVFLSAT